jgi:uncharacterized RDD family membrane protein YckC
VDGIILGIFGTILGGVFFDTFSQLGPYGKLVGFLIAVPYFAVMESSIGGGQSLGKRLLSLRVVDAQGKTLPFEQSFLRYTVFSAPLFLNRLALPMTKTSWIISILLGVIVFGVGGVTLYLMIFNRNTRQGLHDLAVGSYVVWAGNIGPVESKSMWKNHWAVVGFLLVTFTTTLAVLNYKMEKWDRFPQLLQDVRLIEQIDDVQNVTAQEPRLLNRSGDRTRKVLIVDITCARNPTNREAYVDQAVKIILQNDPRVQEYDVLSIGITRSYDIGIASGWISQRFGHSPAEWNQLLFGVSPAPVSTQTQQ